jgi:hypothetical protein
MHHFPILEFWLNKADIAATDRPTPLKVYAMPAPQLDQPSQGGRPLQPLVGRGILSLFCTFIRLTWPGCCWKMHPLYAGQK